MNDAITKVLTLDQGACTGWSIRTRPDRVMSGTEDFSQYAGVDGRVHHHYERWLEGFLRTIRPQVVTSEAPIFRGYNSEYLYGFSVILQKLCFEMQIRTERVNLSTVKKAISNHGHADKERMIQAVRQLGYDVRDEHEADAVAILLFRERQHGTAVAYTGKTISLSTNHLTRQKRARRGILA